jgi:phosphocarrier protein
LSQGTISKSATICNRRGLHARASAKFVALAETFDANIEVSNESEGPDGEQVCGTSIMGLMMLAAAMGCTIRINATGAEAQQAVDALADLVERRFEEDA